ncbi:MAG: GGDEF domain-containing protein [Paucibacter sp.]|nr:GGDEF domain-containing protein [Roseateles sp.]
MDGALPAGISAFVRGNIGKRSHFRVTAAARLAASEQQACSSLATLNRPANPAFIDASSLRLDQALQLLQQAGVALPDVDSHSALWIQGVIDALCDLSSKDALTGLANRRSFEMTLEREIDRVARSGEPALLLTLDIDHFKAVNDTHGHNAGDLVIQAVARAVAQVVRPMDTVARVGGEEFAIILPNCATAFALVVAERVREQVAEQRIEIAPGQLLRVTVSVGGAFAPQWVRSSAVLWMERADRQLYRAKTEGRDRVCMEPQVDSMVSAEEKGLLFAMTQLETE